MAHIVHFLKNFVWQRVKKLEFIESIKIFHSKYTVDDILAEAVVYVGASKQVR